MKDGEDHINVYSKGATRLGRELSNFAYTPFTWGTKSFASVEAWWYWMQLDRDDEKLRAMHGFKAKQYGQKLGKCKPAPNAGEVETAYRYKLDANPALLDSVIACQLPFDHYYVYNGQIQHTPHRWTGILWNKVRDTLIKERELP